MLDLQQLFRTKKFEDKTSITTNDMYELFPEKNKVSEKEFLLISKVFNYLLIEYIVRTGHTIRFPNKLGTLSVRYTKPTNKAVDYKHLKETGEIAYHENRATEGKIVSFVWDKRTPYCLNANARFFKFKPAEEIKKILTTAVTENFTINKYYPRD